MNYPPSSIRFPSWKDDIKKYISKRDFNSLKDILSQFHPADLADILFFLTPKEQEILFEVLDNKSIAQLFKYYSLDTEVSLRLLKKFDIQRFANIISEMPDRLSIDLLSHFPQSVRNDILSCLSKERGKILNNFIESSNNTALSIMSRDYMTLNKDLTVTEVMDIFKKLQHSYYKPPEVYVVDENNILVGMVDLHTLLLEEQQKKLCEIMKDCPLRVLSDRDKFEVSKLILKYSQSSIPVVDKKNILLGIITSETAYYILSRDYNDRITAIAGLPIGFTRKGNLTVFFIQRLLWLFYSLIIPICATFLLYYLLPENIKTKYFICLLPPFFLSISISRQLFLNSIVLMSRFLHSKMFYTRTIERLVSETIVFLSIFIFIVFILLVFGAFTKCGNKFWFPASSIIFIATLLPAVFTGLVYFFINKRNAITFLRIVPFLMPVLDILNIGLLLLLIKIM